MGERREVHRHRMHFHVQSTRGLCRTRVDDHFREVLPSMEASG